MNAATTTDPDAAHHGGLDAMTADPVECKFASEGITYTASLPLWDHRAIIGIMDPEPLPEPVEHPLSVAMAAGWLWLDDVPRGLVVILHRSGLWVECDEDYLWQMAAEETEAIAIAMKGALSTGAIGLHHVEGTLTGGRFTAKLVKVAALPTTTSPKES